MAFIPDQQDTCLICGKPIPPGPDFCSSRCENKAEDIQHNKDVGLLLQTMTKQVAEDILRGYDWCPKHGRELSLYADFSGQKKCPSCVAEDNEEKRKLINKALETLGFEKWVG